MHGYFLQLNQLKMAKSRGDFLRIQTLIDRGIDPLVYRYFCLNAHYRSRLTFSWESLDGAATALSRLRSLVYEMGQAGPVDEAFIDEFLLRINNDLNMPRALALTWELIKSDLPDAVKKGTMLEFDKVLGLKLASWEPAHEEIPAEIISLLDRRQAARAEKMWHEADRLRDQIAAAGFEVEDTPEGPRIRRQSR